VRTIEEIHREIDTIKYEVDLIHDDVERIKDKLIDHIPEHFSRQDFIRSFLGTLFVGFSVLFSGNLINMANNLPEAHFYVIIIGTFLILTAEIYIISYSRIIDKGMRRFGQFWLKRIVSFYITAVLVALGLAYLFGLQYLLPSGYAFVRVVVVLSAPCAIGASIGDLLKKY